MARLRAVEADLAERMVQDPMHTSHSAGVAAGFGECRRWLESLSRSSCVVEENTNTEPAEGDPALRDIYSP